MSITITTKKTVTDAGKIGYVVTKIEALREKELPEMYISGKNYTVWKEKWFQEDSLCINTQINVERFVVGRFYTTTNFEELWNFVTKAGKHLMVVNETLHELRKAWKGVETFRS